MDRRRFLGLAVAAPFGLDGIARKSIAAATERVVIVGAGLAGLRTAQLLRAAGLEVVVLEARAHPGGRVRTIRDPFDHGLHGEAGAIRISGAHRRVLTAVREHGQTLVPFAPPTGAALSVIGGKRIPSIAPPAAAYAGFDLHAEERGLEPAALLERYVAGLPAELSDPDASPAEQAGWTWIDRRSWPAWLRSRGASPAAISLMTLGGDSADLSALYVLRQVMLHRGAQAYFKVAGGMDLLPRAMAARLGNMIHYEAPVPAIDRGASGLGVTYLDGGAPRTLSADRVVLAIPFSVLREMSIDPPLSPDKRRAIRDLAYFAGTRFLLQCRKRFWRDEGLSGSARTDQPVEMWEASYEQSGPTGILGATAAGEAGRKALQIDEEAALKLGLDLAAVSFPSIRAHFERGVVHRWASARWSRGAFAAFKPGQMSALTPHIAGPEDRLHFAGEHTSPWTGWMEGALESAERVASEILGAGKRADR